MTKGKSIARRVFKHENAILGVILAGLIVATAIVSGGQSIQPANVRIVMLQASARGLASIGQAIVILGGGIDISIAGIGTFASLVGAQLITEAPWLSIVGQPLPLYVGILVVLLVGAGWGTLNGVLVSRVGLPGLIVTLGMWQICNGFAIAMTGGQSIAYMPEGLSFFGMGNIGVVPVPVIFLIIAIVVAYFVLNYTGFGRAVYASGGNPASAWLSGVDVKKIKLIVYIISGFMAGAASVLISARLNSVTMQGMLGLELDSIAAVALGGVSLAGGRGNLIGVVLGVAIVAVLTNSLVIFGTGVALQDIVKGAVIVAAVTSDIIRYRK